MNGITAFVREQLAVVDHALEASAQEDQRRRRSTRRQNPRWTSREDEKLRRLYASGGRAAARKAFPNRTPAAVDNRCNKLRLVGAPHVSLGRIRWRLQCAIEKVQAIEAELAARLARSGAKNATPPADSDPS